MTALPRNRAAVLLAAITLVGAALRLQGVTTQPLLGDEQWAAATAVHFVRSGQLGPTMWYHPPSRNLVLWVLGEGFGYGPLALRATSLALGILSIPLVTVLLYLLTKDRMAALVAAALLSLEQVHVTFSRQAIQETWTTFFILLASTLAVMAWQRRRPSLLALSGVLFGLGMSSKLHALFPLAALGVTGLVLAWRERSRETAAWVFASLAVLPAAVYLLTWAPWFARGYGLLDWVEMQRVLLSKMATHAGNPMDQVIDLAAWQWFLRPMGYANFVFHGGEPFVTIAWSNPATWLLVLPATAWLARRPSPPDTGVSAAGERFVLLLFAASYLPLALATRPIWLVSAVAVLPFAAMILGLAVSRVVRAGRRPTRLAIAWGAVVVATSFALYPMAIGRGRSWEYLSPIVERFRPPVEPGPLTP